MEFELKGNFFNGQYIFPKTTGPEATEHYIEKFCPSNLEQKLWKCLVDYSHIDPIVESAKIGFKTWRLTDLEIRVQVLKRYQEQIVLVKEELSKAISLETGRPLWESLIEVEDIIKQVDICISDSLPRIATRPFSDASQKTSGKTIYRPIGPCLIIGPFNEPCSIVNSKILSALISGNSVIVKPSEKTCYSGQLLIDSFIRSEFPKGVINLIQGGGETGRRLVQNKEIKGVLFTGSKETGKKIIQSTYKDLGKIVSLELGGKNVSVVCKNANVQNTLTELIKGCFLSSGQNCRSTSIVAIHKDLQETFIKSFHEMAKKIIVDHPLNNEQEPFMGPLVDKKALDNYLLFIGMAKREGIEEIMRGKVLHKKYQGHYVSPSIHLTDHFNPKSHFLVSEILGPNCTFIPFEKIDEAIKIVNATDYGLVSSIFTEDNKEIDLCLREIETGTINLNRSTILSNNKLTFNNVKNSGNHRPSGAGSIESCSFQLSYLKSEEGFKERPLKGLN